MMRHPERDFRKDHYWHIRNFNASNKLPRSTFSHAMSRVKKAGNLGHLPGGLGMEVHYQLADRFCSGREGHCFGMSVAAVKEWQEKKLGLEKSAGGEKKLGLEKKSAGEKKLGLEKSATGERVRVSEVRALTPEIREEILALHLKQLELDYLGYVVGLFAKGELFASFRSMARIVEMIDREGCALVNVVDVKKLAGHTVVAYDYRKDAKTGDYIVYVADSNHPWSEEEEGARRAAGTFGGATGGITGGSSGKNSGGSSGGNSGGSSGKNLGGPKSLGQAKSTRHPSYIRLLRGQNGKTKAGLYYRNRCEGRYDVVFGVPYKYIK